MSFEASPVQVTPLYTGDEADELLLPRFGLTTEGCRDKIWMPTLTAMRQAHGRYGPHAVPGAKGSEAFHRGTEELRLRLLQRGWYAPKHFAKLDLSLPIARRKKDVSSLEASGLAIDTGCHYGVSLVQGDSTTGRRDHGGPSVKHERGEVPQFYAQGVLFGEAPTQSFEWLFLLHHITEEGWQAELIKPRSISRSGWVTEWDWGVLIVDESFSAGQAPVPGPSPLPSPLVRRNTQATG